MFLLGSVSNAIRRFLPQPIETSDQRMLLIGSVARNIGNSDSRPYYYCVNGFSSGLDTLAPLEAKAGKAGVVKRISVGVNTSAREFTVDLMINGMVAASVPIASGLSNSRVDVTLTEEVGFTANDRLAWAVNAPGNIAFQSIDLNHFELEVAYAGSAAFPLSFSASRYLVTVGEPAFFPVVGGGRSNTPFVFTASETGPAGGAGRVFIAGVMRDIRVQVLRNTSDADTVFSLYRNNVSVASAVCPAGSNATLTLPGEIEVAEGDLLYYGIASPARTSGSVEMTAVHAVFESADDRWMAFVGTSPQTLAQGSGKEFLPLTAASIADFDVEASVSRAGSIMLPPCTMGMMRGGAQHAANAASAVVLKNGQATLLATPVSTNGFNNVLSNTADEVLFNGLDRVAFRLAPRPAFASAPNGRLAYSFAMKPRTRSSKSMWTGGDAFYTLTSSPRYQNICGYRYNYADEGRCVLTVSRSTVLSKLAVFVSENSKTSDTTVTVRINGVSTAVFVTIPPGAVGWFYSDPDVSVTASPGNNTCLMITNGSSGNLHLSTSVIEAESPLTPVAYYVWAGASGATFGQEDARVYYGPISGRTWNATNWGWRTEISNSGPWRTKVGATGFMRRVQCTVGGNTCNGPVVFHLMRNGVETGASLTVPQGVQSQRVFADIDVPCAPGDIFMWKLDLTAVTSGVMSPDMMAIEFVSSDGSWDMQSAYPDNSQVSNLQRFLTPVGDARGNALEQNRQVLALFPMNLKNLRFLGGANFDTARDLTVRVNGSDTPLKTPFTTGFNFNSQSMSAAVEVAVGAGDFFCIDKTPPVSGGSDYVFTLGLTGVSQPEAPVPPYARLRAYQHQTEAIFTAISDLRVIQQQVEIIRSIS